MLKQINFNLEAITYLRSCLAQGDTISHYLLDLPLEQGEIFTFLPDTINLSTVNNFEVGGVTQKQTTYITLANLICSYFKSNENGIAIFEAIEQPDDACLASFSEQFITYQHEVYYLILNQGHTLEQIKRVLQRARAYPFIGILTSNSILSYSYLKSNEPKELAIHADYILVGAYDDEGVLIWHKNSNYPKLLQETTTESKSLDLHQCRI